MTCKYFFASDVCLFWWGKLKERDHLGEKGPRWEDNNKMDLQELGCGDMDWMELAQDRDS